jgi:hypothetical protein
VAAQPPRDLLRRVGVVEDLRAVLRDPSADVVLERAYHGAAGATRVESCTTGAAATLDRESETCEQRACLVRVGVQGGVLSQAARRPPE